MKIALYGVWRRTTLVLCKNSIRLPPDLNVTLLHSDRLAKLCFPFQPLKGADSTGIRTG